MFRGLLAAEFAPYHALSDDQLAKLEAHYRLLMLWNQQMNLTRITELVEVVRLHYCESLFLACQLPARPLKIADIGSGGGFPGIPIAIIRPESSVDLVEAHQRKAVFLREASRELPNVRVLAQRAETLDPIYDLAVARGVRPSAVEKIGLAKCAALLVGKEDAEGFDAENLKLPWGEGRYMVRVSRGT